MIDGSWEVRCALYGDTWVMPGYVDIQFEYGVHSPLVIVEKGVVYCPTAAHRRVPSHDPQWYDWEAVSALLHRCVGARDSEMLLWISRLSPYRGEVYYCAQH